jgi:hypothetical protein
MTLLVVWLAAPANGDPEVRVVNDELVDKGYR